MRRNKSSTQYICLLAPLFLFGCAAGNQYMYKTESVGLPLDPREEAISIAVGVKDNRPYVLNGDKPPTFVGLQRGGFGNPFNVTTASGKPFAEDVTDVLADMLRRSGYLAKWESTVEFLPEFTEGVAREKLPMGVYVQINEWKTDVYASVQLHYDLELFIVDGEGSITGTATQAGSEPIGGWTMSGNDQRASQSLATKLSYLFVDPEIQAAME